MRRRLVRMLQCFERRPDGVVNVGRGPDRHASSGESRVVAQHAIRLRAMIARRSVGLDRQRRGDPEGEDQEDGHDGAASHPETSHRLKNPPSLRNRQVFEPGWTVP